jgi:hypothetical protein
VYISSKYHTRLVIGATRLEWDRSGSSSCRKRHWSPLPAILNGLHFATWGCGFLLRGLEVVFLSLELELASFRGLGGVVFVVEFCGLVFGLGLDQRGRRLLENAFNQLWMLGWFTSRSWGYESLKQLRTAGHHLLR